MTTTLTDVQAAIIAKLKATPSVTSLLSDPKEIREIEWVGSTFTYPNIRVRVAEFERKNPDCDIFIVKANIFVFGENASSKTCNVIANEIYNLMDRKTITGTNVKSVTRIQAKQFGADYIPESGVWKSEVNLIFHAT